MKSIIKILFVLLFFISAINAQNNHVGINEQNPEATLHVKGDTVIFMSDNGNGNLYFLLSDLGHSLKSADGILIKAKNSNIYLNPDADNGEVIIGGSLGSNASKLTINSSDKGILIPRMSTVDINTIVVGPSEKGLLVFDTTESMFKYYDSTDWLPISTKNGAFENVNGVVRNTGNNTTDDFIFGADELPLNNTTTTNSNIFFFDKSKGAFRAGGLVNSDVWNTDFIGSNSIAMGFNTKASGGTAISLGSYNEASGLSSVSFGIFNKSLGNYSTTIGSYSESQGNFSTAIGYSAKAKGKFSVTMGAYTESSAAYETTFGRYNTINVPISSVLWDGADRLFVIGNGLSDVNRKDAMVIRQNGKVIFGKDDSNFDFTFHTPDSDSTTLLISPSTSSNGEKSSLLLAEDKAGNYGMGFQYDGGTNVLKLFGKSNNTIYDEIMLVKRNGSQIAFGDTFADGYKLTVDGKVICTELQIELKADWPDYVFKDDYDLMLLSEVKSFIDINGHLPNIPKAEKIESEGLPVGQMNKLLMEKIEELTLHLIRLDEENKELVNRLDHLENSKK